MLICRKKLSTTYLVVLIMWFVPKSILLPKKEPYPLQIRLSKKKYR